MQEMAEKCNFDNFASLIDGIELSASAPPAVPSVLPLVDPIDKHEALFYIEVNEKQERSVSTDNNHNVIHDDNDIKNNNNIKTCEETLDSLSDPRELDQLSPIKKPKEHHHNHQNHGTTTTESMLIDSDDVIIDDDTAATMLTHRVTFEEGYGGNTNNNNNNNGNNEKENENDSDRQRTPLRSARRKRYISMNSYFVPIESAYHTPRTSGAGAAHCSSPSGNSNNNNNNNNSNNNNNNSNNNLDSTVGSDSSEYIMMDNDARLRRAVLEGDEKRVRRYVCAKKANVNTVYPTTKQTCLHVAASRNYTGIMNILLENGASVDATDYLKSTPLHWACSKGQLEAAEVLLAHEASTHSRDRYGYSPFHLSIRNGHYHVAEALLMFGADINFKRSADGTTALHMAMAKGDLDAIRFLFHHGARLHIKDSNGDSCLFLAAGNNHVEAIKLIIECVMRKNLQHKSTSIEYTPIKKFLLTRDNTGGTLVHRAAREGHPEMIRFLLNIDNSFLRSVVAKYEFELEGNLQDLIRADPHKFEYELLKAAAADNMSAFSSIRQLSGLHQKSWQQRNTRIFNVDDQCLVPATSVYGCTALHIAAMHCRVQAAEVLLKMRASVNLRDKSAETALHKCFRGIALAQQLAAQSAAAASASSPQATTTTTTTAAAAAAENDTQQQQQPHHQPNSSSGDTGIGYDDHDNDDYGPVNNNNNPIHNHSHNNDSSDHDTKGSWIHRRQSQATKAALRWRVSVRLPDTNDKNEFQLSAQRGAMIWLLLSNGANTRIKNNKGESCRHMMKKLNISVKLRK